MLSSFTHSGAERAGEAGSRRPKEAAGVEPTGEWGPEQKEEGGGRRGPGKGEVEEGSKAVERLPDTLGSGLTAGSCAQEEKRVCWEARRCPVGPGAHSWCNRLVTSVSETPLTWLFPPES